jgi:hypothetical protein
LGRDHYLGTMAEVLYALFCQVFVGLQSELFGAATLYIQAPPDAGAFPRRVLQPRPECAAETATTPSASRLIALHTLAAKRCISGHRSMFSRPC